MVNILLAIYTLLDYSRKVVRHQTTSQSSTWNSEEAERPMIERSLHTALSEIAMQKQTAANQTDCIP